MNKINEKIEKNKLLNKFIEERLTGNSQITYLSYLKRYFKEIKQIPEEHIKKDLKQIENDLITFIRNEKQKDVPPQTIHTIKASITKFLLFNDIELSAKAKDQIKYMTKGTSTLTLKETPTPKQLREILQHGETKARAMFLMASSSGMRIGEILKLTPNNIDRDHQPTKIMIGGKHTKTGSSRITFISDEATETLKAWLKERDNWLNKKATAKPKHIIYNRKSTTIKLTDENRIFPMGYTNARQIWERLIIKSGYNQKDPDTDRYKYTIHSLRAFFKSRLLIAGINPKIIDLFAGHRTALDRAYYNLHQDELIKEYLKAMPELQVFGDQQISIELEEKLKKTEETKEEQEKKIRELYIENERLKGIIQDMIREFNTYKMEHP